MSLALTRNFLAELKLNGMLAALDKAVMDALQLKWSPTEFTNVLLQAEADDRRERKTANLIRAAHFKDKVALQDFDFTAERSISKPEIKDIHGLEWMRQGRPLLLIGQTGGPLEDVEDRQPPQQSGEQLEGVVAADHLACIGPRHAASW